MTKTTTENTSCQVDPSQPVLSGIDWQDYA